MSEASGRGRACLANATRLLDGKLVVPIPAQRCRHGRCDDEPHWPGQPGRARWRGQPLPQRSPHFGALQRIGGARKKWLWTVLLAKADILGHGRDEVCPCEEAVGTAAESVDVVRVLRRRVAAYTGSCSYRRLAFRRRGYGCPQCRRRSHHTHTWEVSRQRDEGDEKHVCCTQRRPLGVHSGVAGAIQTVFTAFTLLLRRNTNDTVPSWAVRWSVSW